MPEFFKDIILIMRELLCSPHVRVSLGPVNEDSSRIYTALNSRHPKWWVIRNKTRGVALIPLKDYDGFQGYADQYGGKNSAIYYTRKAGRAGYVFRKMNPWNSLADIREINSSATDRQGKPMDDTYTGMDIQYPDRPSHLYYGVFFEEKLIAYLWLQVAGELVLVNRILGHANHLRNGIMYLLLTSAVAQVYDHLPGVRFMMYDTFPGATAGLRLFKKRLGFKSYKVTWTLQKD